MKSCLWTTECVRTSTITALDNFCDLVIWLCPFCLFGHNGEPAKWRAFWGEIQHHIFSYNSMDFIAKKENPDAKTEGEETIVIRVCDSVRGKLGAGVTNRKVTRYTSV